MQRRLLTGLLLVCCYSPLSIAGTSTKLDMSLLLGDQVVFTGLVKDLGGALSYKAISPAETLGTIGFDVGVEFSRTSLESNAVEVLTVDSAPSSVIIPKVHAHVGIPFIDIDLGAFYTSIPDSNIDVVGGEIKYGLIEGGTVMPALSIRGTFSSLSGVNDLDLSTKGLELSISKGILMATPYAGVGIVRVTGSSPGVSDVEEDLNKLYVGLNFNMGIMNLAAETEKTGDNSTASLKIGIRF